MLQKIKIKIKNEQEVVFETRYKKFKYKMIYF